MRKVLILMAVVFGVAGFNRAVLAENQMVDGSMVKHDMPMEAISAHGKYAEYSPAAFDEARDMKRVYFFYAGWCPSCKATERVLKERMADIPAGVRVFKVDYDSSVELKARYAVAYQDTFVQVDKDGAKMAQWNGGGVDGLMKNVK
ncbi:MAG: thioredoxin family protein [Candidatus Omnitrophota bacterium]